MKINTLNKIIKINVVMMLVVTSFTFSFAQNLDTEKDISVINKFLNIFKSKESPKISIESVATNTMSTTSTSSEILLTADDKKEEKVEIKEVKKEEKKENIIEVKEIKKEAVKEVLCENKIKINTKKEKINKQIKNQIVDKNKLIDTLITISASTTIENKDLLDEKIMKLESEVSDIIKKQKDLVNILNSNTFYTCGANTKNINKIKDLEKNIDTKAETINKIIKEEIKDVLKNVE